MISLKCRRRHNDTHRNKQTQIHKILQCSNNRGSVTRLFTLPVGVKAELLKEQSNGTKIVAAPGRLLCAPLTGLAKISIVSYLMRY